ncbi:hypothetical protein COOONC_22083 [Cooperia oncophora]
MKITSNTLPIAMILMYVIIFIKIRHTSHGGGRSEVARLKQEIKYLVQTVLISLLIVVEMVAFITVPFIGVTGYGQFYLNILLNLIIISNNLISPIVIFAFNSEVRQRMPWAVLYRKNTTIHAPTTLF